MDRRGNQRRTEETTFETSAMDSSIISASYNNQLLNGGGSVVVLKGLCSYCRKVSTSVCNRCRDFYCSPNCQRADWHRHRYICFPMPTLISAAEFISTSNETLPLMTASTFAKAKQEDQQKVLESILRSPQQSNGDVRAAPSQQQQQPTKPKLSAPTKPKANSLVLLTGFRSPNRCFVRPLLGAANDDFGYVENKIDVYGRTAPPLSKLPKPYSYAIAQLQGVHYRVQVIAVRNASNIRILFVDSGTTAVRGQAELREISDEILHLPQYAVCVHLHNVENYSKNDRLMSFLAGFQKKEFRIQYCEEDERSVNVTLYHWQTDKCLNDEITKYGTDMQVFSSDKSGVEATSNNKRSNEPLKAKPTKREHDGVQTKEVPTTVAKADSPMAAKCVEDVKPLLTAPYATVTFENNVENLKVIVLDNSCLDFGYFGCIAEEDMKYLLAVQKHLKQLDATKQPYSPRLNEYCIAKYEDDWYRAKVIEVLDKKQFTVTYVDFTNESTLTENDIRPYPIDLKTECRTNLCLLDGLPENLSDAQIKFLKNELQFYTKFMIGRVSKIEEDIAVVECPELIKKMHDNV